ncbi:MAG: uroporphyrinogen-III C-methyltransferase [Synergistaceae bacterium]|jgi:uroporphyrinogen III methyltransferase/synthase|nr:uroporphyrinogen-III C-methyltransferase [Synergistaceae bacterium]
MGVTLVGAGCGSPRLLTAAAAGCISKADHVVYDRLIHPDILQLAPRSCAFHQAGKKESRHTLPQDEINGLLIKLGRQGGNVVRLKGGDPFVFGRGGEEAIALEAAGVEWSAIPGVTSALGGALCSGLPLTHRDVSPRLSLSAAHRRHDLTDNDDALVRRLAEDEGTVALYMGASAFADLSDRLLEMGRRPDTPVALIVWGGWGRARRIDGDLAGMSVMSRRVGLPSPAVIYVGGTAGMKLSPKKGPLAGMQLAICRPYPECWETGRALEEFGADCYGLPLLALDPLPHKDAKEVSDALRAADWLVLSSPRGAAELKRAVRDLRGIRGRVAAIGEGTASALRAIGVEPDLVAGGTSENLADSLRKAVRPGELVIFARNERASNAAFAAAREAGALVRSLSTYRMTPREVPGLDVMREQWESCGLDAVVFGSAALAEEYSRVIGMPPDSARLIAWGAACADAAGKIFGRKIAKLSTPDISGLVETLSHLSDT